MKLHTVLKQKIDINNPTLVKLRDMRLKYMLAEMKKILLLNCN